jgi:hypothetical protein
MTDIFSEKTLLVTGGTGSFSSKPLDTAPQMGAKTIRIFSRGQSLPVQLRAGSATSGSNFPAGPVRSKEFPPGDSPLSRHPIVL